MGQKGVVFTTTLTIRECSDMFRQAADRVRGGFGRMLSGGAKMANSPYPNDFFTPTFDSPFATVDGVPDFAVGIVIFAVGGSPKPVHMYVDEKNSFREVQLISKHGLTGGSRSARITGQFLDQFRSADQNLTVTDGNL